MGRSKKYTKPKNTMGLGNPSFPYGSKSQGNLGNTGKDFHDPKYRVGSGDK